MLARGDGVSSCARRRLSIMTRPLAGSAALAIMVFTSLAHAGPVLLRDLRTRNAAAGRALHVGGLRQLPAGRPLAVGHVPGGRGATASVLAFHVDYWDRLGWKDRFASAQYTARQHASMRANGSHLRLHAAGARAGTRRRRGAPCQGRRDRCRRAGPSPRARCSRSMRPPSTRFPATRACTRRSPTSRRGANAQLWLAYTDSGLVSDVKAGENRGVQLAHDHVVRALYGPYPVDDAGEVERTVAVAPPASAAVRGARRLRPEQRERRRAADADAAACR